MSKEAKFMNDKESNIPFPCEFPIKIMGQASISFEKEILPIIEKHVPDYPHGEIKVTPSKGGKYISITVIINAQSKTQLEKLYGELNALPEVSMVL